jgi:hypothetical protein
MLNIDSLSGYRLPAACISTGSSESEKEVGKTSSNLAGAAMPLSKYCYRSQSSISRS